MRGFIFILLSGMFLGTIGPMVRLTEGLGPFTITFFRTVFAALVVLAIILAERKTKELKLSGKEVPSFFWFGFFGVFINFATYVAAFSYTTIANVVFLTYTHVAFTFVLAAIFLGEKITQKAAIAFGLMIAGFFIINNPSLGFNLGNLLAIIAGLGFSVWSIMIKFEERSHSEYVTLFWPLVVGSLLLFPLAVFEGSFNAVLPNIGHLVIMGVISTGLAYIFYAKALEFIEAHKGDMLLGITEPLVAILLATFLIGESLSASTLSGGILIVAAGMILNREKKRD